MIADRYRVEEELASGGSGIVYRVVDTRDGSIRALKCLRSDRADTRAFKLFRDEYRTLCQLTHPRIVSVYDYGVYDTGAYYTMELLDGIDVREAAPLPMRDVCRLLRDVASALAVLHARRLLHRDVSYRNVRCTADGCAKLIDFGAMTSVGATAEVIGTPPFIPPEALSGKGLEPRADLYSLGALAYWMLTARHAYPANNLQMLQRLWSADPPAHVSALVEDIPLELDRLIMSMLSQDPQGRPASAAEVMDRLSAIADLPQADDLAAAHAYLSKPALVGRERERHRIREYLRRDAGMSRRGPILIEGTEGVGKTRMLEELVIEAKLAGWFAISPGRSIGAEPFAVARELLEHLCALVPEIPSLLSEDDRGLIALLFPGFGTAANVPATLSPAELRTRQQAALARCFVRASQDHRLCLAIDDFQAIDAESIALLAALAGEATGKNLCLGLVVRPADHSDGPALRIARQLGIPLRLRRLASMEVTQLVESLFGDVPNSGRVAHWLFEHTHGNPLECSELAQYLVACEAIRYSEGSWILPTSLPREVPQGLAQTRKARLAALPIEQRCVAEAVAVFEAPIPAELCAQIMGMRESDTVRALGALVQVEVLREQAGNYLFQAEALRTEVLKQLHEDRAEALHERTGELLLEQPGLDFHMRVRTAHHLMRGGSRRRGANLIVAIARDSSVARDVSEAFTAPLELAVEILRAEHAAPVEIIPLLIRLLNAAFLYDHELITYGAELIPQLWRDAGLDLLPSIDVSSPDWVSALIPLATQRYNATPERERGLPPSEALAVLSGVSVLMLAAAILKWDIPMIRRTWEAVEPLARLGAVTPLAAAPELVGIGLRGLTVGESADHEGRVAYLERLRDPAKYPGFPEARRVSILATQFHNIGMATSVLDGATALRLADEIDAFDLQMYRGAAMQVRFIVHMYRGEFEQAERYRARLDVLALQGGAGTQFELWLAPYLADPYALCDDVVGLKQAAAHLQRLAAASPGYLPMALIATGHHCRVRGYHEKALEAFQEARKLAPRDEHASWLLAISGHVDALTDAGRYAEALALGRELLGTLNYGPRFTALVHHRLARSLALAEAHSDRLADGIQRCERAIANELALGQSPLHLGRLHEALARIALLTSDANRFAQHLLKVREYFASTRNPTLIKRHDRLAILGRENFPSVTEITSEDDLYAHNALRSLAELKTTAERTERALALILQELHVEHGYLFLARGSQLEFVASTTREPPHGLITLLTTMVSELQDDTVHTITVTGDAPAIETTTLICDQQEFVPVPLILTLDGAREVVGVVAIPVEDVNALRIPQSRLVSAITASLYSSVIAAAAPA